MSCCPPSDSSAEAERGAHAEPRRALLLNSRRLLGRRLTCRRRVWIRRGEPVLPLLEEPLERHLPREGHVCKKRARTGQINAVTLSSLYCMNATWAFCFALCNYPCEHWTGGQCRYTRSVPTCEAGLSQRVLGGGRGVAAGAGELHELLGLLRGEVVEHHHLSAVEDGQRRSPVRRLLPLPN